MDPPDHKHLKEGSSVKDEASLPAGTWQQIFKVSSNQYCGFVESVETAKELIRRYEQETTTKFSCYKSYPSLGYGDPYSQTRKVFFKTNKVPFDGVPFMITGSKIYDCQHGLDRNKSKKNKSSSYKENDHSFQKRRFLHQDTIKFGCPVQIVLSEVIKFPGYKVKDDTARIKRDMSDALRDKIKKGEQPEFERKIYISLPKTEDHKYHVIRKVGGMLQPIDKRLIEKIQMLVGEGVRNIQKSC